MLQSVVGAGAVLPGFMLAIFSNGALGTSMRAIFSVKRGRAFSNAPTVCATEKIRYALFL